MMRGSAQVRVGVIGAGWGQLQIEAFRRAKNAQVVALCDVDAAKREKIAKEYAIPNTFADYRELIQSDVQLVSIASPPDQHAEMLGAAIHAGKHVLTEKPLALDLPTARALLADAEDKGIVHAVDFEMRCLPAHAYAKELIDEDYVGQLLRVDVTMALEHPWGEHGNWAVDEARGGGILSELGVPFIDLLRWWFGDVTAVLAGRRTHFPTVRIPAKDSDNGKSVRQLMSADDAFWGVMQFARGGEALLNFISGARYDPGWSVSIYGRTGSLIIKSGQLLGMREGDREIGLVPIPKRLELGDSPKDPLLWATARLFERVAAKISREGEAAPFPDFGDAIAVQQIAHAIRRASDERRWTDVE